MIFQLYLDTGHDHGDHKKVEEEEEDFFAECSNDNNGFFSNSNNVNSTIDTAKVRNWPTLFCFL